MDEYGGLWLEFEVFEAQSDQFRDTKAGREGQMQHRAVSDTCWSCRIRHVEEYLNLLMGQVVNEPLIGLFHGDSMDAARLIKTRRQAVFQEAEEGVDSGQSGIAGFRTVAAFGLDVLEECKHQWRIDLFEF